MDDELVLSVDSVLKTTLKNSNATFIKMSRKEFPSIQELFVRMWSMVYRFFNGLSPIKANSCENRITIKTARSELI